MSNPQFTSGPWHVSENQPTVVGNKEKKLNYGQYFSYIQYDGENAFEVACKTYSYGYIRQTTGILVLDTQNGRHLVKKGTVIVQYSDGKLIFMKEETFKEKYPDLKL